MCFFIYLFILKWIIEFFELNSLKVNCFVNFVLLMFVGLINKKELIGWFCLFRFIWLWWIVLVILLMVLFCLIIWVFKLIVKFFNWVCFFFFKLLIGMLVFCFIMVLIFFLVMIGVFLLLICFFFIVCNLLIWLW